VEGLDLPSLRIPIKFLGSFLTRAHRQISEQFPVVCYEIVGRLVFHAVLPLLKARGRIPLCGLIADYNGDLAAKGKCRTAQVMLILLQ
jgi:NADPH-dependent curcumin reductase CurA